MAILELKGVTKKFGGLVAVKALDLKVQEGEIVGLIGPNGAGKTTAFNLIACAMRPTDGEILFQGTDLVGMRPFDACELGVGRTFQVVKPFGEMSVLHNVTAAAFLRHSHRAAAEGHARELLEFAGFTHRAGRNAGDLPVADRKRLELVRALATDPKLLLLDEVMAGFNHREIDDMLVLIRRVRAMGITILLVEHVMKAVMNLCDRVALLHHGEKIAEGTPRQIATDEKAIKAYLGEEYGVATS